MKRLSSSLLLAAGITCGLSFISSVAHADTTTDIDISSQYGGGTVYPGGSWSVALGGSTIVAAPNNGNTGTGITFANWSGNFSEIDAGHDSTFAMGGVALTSDSVVNALINTFYGDNGIDSTVTFTNSNNDTAVYLLYGNQTIRDYNQAFYANSLPGSNTLPGGGAVTARNWWNNGSSGIQDASQRLDVQTFVLPTSWDGTTLTSMNIGVGAGAGADDAFSAVQVVNVTRSTSPVPEPSSLVLLGSGLIGLAGAARRRLARC